MKLSLLFFLCFSECAFARILLFTNPKYIDYHADVFSGTWNLENLARAEGYEVEKTSADSAIALAPLLERNSILIVPEQRHDFWQTTPETSLLLHEFMERGGTIIFTTYAFDLMSRILGEKIDSNHHVCEGTSKTAIGDHSPLGTLPKLLSNPRITYCIESTTLPADIMPLYVNEETHGVAVAYGAIGYGGFYFLAWNFVDAPSQGDDWRELYSKILNTSL